MPQMNNMPQAQNKRSGIIITPDKINDKKIWRVNIIVDENTAIELAQWKSKSGKSPFMLLNSNKAVEFKFPDGEEKMVVNSGLFRELTRVMTENGYEMTPEIFLSAVNKAVNGHDYPTKEELAFVDTSFDAMMNSMFDQFEKKINDPAVQHLLENMHVYDPLTGDFKSAAELQKSGIKSAKNVIFALGQWRSYGRSGIPTYVATETQWKRDYNRYVVNGATRLFLYTPNDNRKMPKREVARQYNLTANQLYGNAHNLHAANTHYQNHGEAINGMNGYHMEVFYDITDTEVIPGMDDLFYEHAGLESNLWDNRWNKKALDSGEYQQASDNDKQAVFDAGFTNDEENAQKIINGLNVWCSQNQSISGEIKKMLDANNLVGAVTKYFETDPFFDRDREMSKNERTALLNICVFSVLNHYGVAPTEMLQAYQRSKEYLMRNKQINKKAKIAIMPFFSNFVRMITQNNKQLQTANECIAVGNDFKNLWNRIVETENNNRNVRLW